MLTITRKDLLLTINDNVIPAMGSSDVPVKFVNDTETYVGFLIEPRVGYYVNGCPKSGICEYDTSSNIIKIPAEAFKNKGILVIAIALIDNADSNHIEVTKELALEVTPAPNGTVILPTTDTWQTAVKNLVGQLYNQDYKPQFDEIEENLHNLVKEAQNQQNKANNQQTQIDNAIDVMGDYEIVQEDPTQIRFKKGDGTYGDTVNLGDNLASKSMVNAGYDTYSGNSYSGSASDYGIEIGKASGAYEQEGTPTPESPIEPKFFEPKNGYSVGKNIINQFDLDKYNKEVTQNYNRYTIKGLIPNANYTMSSNVPETSVATLYFAGDQTGINGVFINKPKTFKTDISGNIVFLVRTNDEFGYKLEDFENGTYYIMLNEGETAQEYVPFKGQDTTPISLELRALPNGVKDTYENGVITRRIGVIEFDGSEDEVWSKNSASDNDNWLYYINYYHIKAVALSNKLEHKNIAGSTNIINGDSSLDRVGFNLDYNESVIYINIGYYMQQEGLSNNKGDLKTYLQSNPIKVYYELSTPTTEKVTLPVIPSYFPYTNAWHDSEVEASDLTWNILARQYGSGQTTIKKDEAVLTELDLNTERAATPTTVKVQLQDSEGKVLYLETSSENVYIQSGRFSGKTVQQVLENSIQAISATDEYIEVDVPDSMTQSIDEEFLVDEVDEPETETE